MIWLVYWLGVDIGARRFCLVWFSLTLVLIALGFVLYWFGWFVSIVFVCDDECLLIVLFGVWLVLFWIDTFCLLRGLVIAWFELVHWFLSLVVWFLVDCCVDLFGFDFCVCGFVCALLGFECVLCFLFWIVAWVDFGLGVCGCFGLSLGLAWIFCWV